MQREAPHCPTLPGGDAAAFQRLQDAAAQLRLLGAAAAPGHVHSGSGRASRQGLWRAHMHTASLGAVAAAGSGVAELLCHTCRRALEQGHLAGGGCCAGEVGSLPLRDVVRR